jgi:phosphoribosylanthranilate isomerase
VEDVQEAIIHPIQAIGFILVPNRKRTVTISQVSEMIREIPKQIASVGVFQNPTLSEIDKAVTIGLAMIQLHGQESAYFCQEIKERWGVPIVKVFSENNIDQIPSYQGLIGIVLLDHAAGGLGKKIDWSLIPVVKHYVNQIGVPLWIAGGLNENNIADLYLKYDINGVDLSSGIETDGTKDKRKMTALIERMERDGKIG